MNAALVVGNRIRQQLRDDRRGSLSGELRERLTLRAARRAPAGEIHLSDVIARAERRPHLRAVGALIATVMDKASPASAGRPTH